MGRSRGPGGGSLLAEREVSSLPSISLPPKAAQGGFATALPREQRTIYKRITLCYTAGETEASDVGQCSEAVIAGVSYSRASALVSEGGFLWPHGKKNWLCSSVS